MGIKQTTAQLIAEGLSMYLNDIEKTDNENRSKELQVELKAYLRRNPAWPTVIGRSWAELST